MLRSEALRLFDVIPEGQKDTFQETISGRDDEISEKIKEIQTNKTEFNIQELLNQAASVLVSATVYKPALAANIRAFSRAIATEGNNRELRDRIARLEKDRASQEARLAAIETSLEKRLEEEAEARRKLEARLAEMTESPRQPRTRGTRKTEGKDEELKKTGTTDDAT